MRKLGLLSVSLAGLLLVAGLATFAAAWDDPEPHAGYPLHSTYLLPSQSFVPMVSAATPTEADGLLEYGLDFISAADFPAGEERYQKAIATGAGWNRWPLYWYNVQSGSDPNPASWNWSYGDTVVNADLAHGLETELILLGTPDFYSTAGDPAIPLPDVGGRIDDRDASLQGDYWISSQASPPAGLYESVFADGSDVPAPGKTINANNHWAWFVYHTVDHYSALGITHWEIWNEEDYAFFWSGTPGEYARLLKVAYLAAKHADSGAQILFGGLANFQQPNFLADVLNVFSSDPLAPSYNWFFDILATHSYAYAWESWYHVWRAGRSLDNYGLTKPIWLNESGSPAWDDYPGPTWDPDSGYRSTMDEGAAYVIQSAMYAKYAGADVVFHFQLYDDCGNYPAGTDFPPLFGDPADFCQIYNPCAGDAFGLVRNPTDAQCFTQHPSPDTPRPGYNAYQALTTHLTQVEPLWRQRPGGDDPYNGPQEWIAFYRPSTGERVLGMWARFGENETAVVPATSTGGVLIDRSGMATPVTPVDDTYTFLLQRATNQNLDHAPDVYAIGGPPLILVETDTFPPEVTLTVPPLVPPSFQVSWTGSDLGSGLVDYDLWISNDGGPMMLWLQNTPATSASYVGQPGHTYGFAVVGRDRAGNQGPNPILPQASTRVGEYLSFLPVTLLETKLTGYR
jgi:hypothetical protein